jgi:hypothetical protein
VNPIAGVILAFCLGCVFMRSRKIAVYGLLIGTLFITQDSALIIGGQTFFATRILTLAGMVRVLLRKEYSFRSRNKGDRIIFWLYGYSTLILLLRSDGPAAYRVAKFLDAFSGYIVFRGLIKDLDDVKSMLLGVAIMMVPYAGMVGVEFLTHKSPFTYLGGQAHGWIRGDRVRCFGSFRHPSIMGSLGVTFFPMFFALLWDIRARSVALVGLIACLATVVFSNSGGPLSSFMVGVVGWSLWLIRTRMQLFRRCMLALVLLLALIMKAPIWYLIAKLSSVTGGTGWHRSYLIDIAMRQIDKWGLFGMSLEQTRYWFAYRLAATGTADITNQFISFGLSAGVAALILFVYYFVWAFSECGKAGWRLRLENEGAPTLDERLIWGFAVMITVHMFNLLGITYFDQFYVIWFLQLAALNVAVNSVLTSKSEPDLSEKAGESLRAAAYLA